MWRIIEPVFRSGETYPFSQDITEEEAFQVWANLPSTTYVVEDEYGNIVGTYYMKPNQPSQGAHVCNCGYIVAAQTRNQGIASDMCKHSQSEARSHGFRAMQFNLVVSTNEGAVRLWKKLGFKIIGTLPEAFRHPHMGFVDAHVMYKKLKI